MAETENLDTWLVLILIGIIGMLLLSVAVIIFFIVYQKRLFAQKNKIKGIEADYQKDLLKSSIQAQELERRRVATDLHDGVGSLLSATRLYIQQLTTQKSKADFEEVLSEAKLILNMAIQQTREISHNLLPTELDQFGVLEALEDHCKNIEKSSGLAIDYTYEADYPFTKEQDLAIYRIVQELMNNTLKHAEAKSINIHFNTTEEGIRMHYADNGKGLAPNQKSKGLGMKSIESRVNLLGGKMEIKTDSSKGFHAVVDFAAKQS